MKWSGLVGCISLGMLLVATSTWAASLPDDLETAAMLQNMGFENVLNLEDGSEGLLSLYAAGSGHGSAAPATRAVKLPERLDSAELKRMLMDLPGTFEIVDVRPPEQFADFSLPGSTNADIADVITNPAYLNGAVPLIIVDRDGSLAMAAGGILSQRTKRSVKVLYGGLEAYWKDSVAPLPPLVPAPASVPAAKPAPVPVTPATPTPAAPETPKKQSAGC